MLSYAITDPAYYGSDPETLTRHLRRLLSGRRVDLVCLRDKRTDRYGELAEAFCALMPEFPDTRFLLHTDWRLAKGLGAFGVHLPTAAIDEIPRAKEAGLWVVASTHSLEEARRARRLGADAVTFGPVFATPGKGAPQGLEKLKEIRDRISIKTIALGGILSREQIDAVAETGADGFASIRYFANIPEGNETI
jgi:thiamine-phosphate pyrophosphorylase